MVKRQDMSIRTRALAVRIIRLFTALPKSQEALVIGKQVLRSGTSIGAHYSEATRARSTAEFVAKLGVGLQELSETAYWLDLLVDAKIMESNKLTHLRGEVEELIAMFVAMTKSAQKKTP